MTSRPLSLPRPRPAALPSRRALSRRLAVLALLAAPFAPAPLLAAPPASEAGPARFVVTSDAVTPPLAPITATIAGDGAGARLMPGGGFEPVILRTRIIAEADSPDSILAQPNDISRYDTLREGALDGAEVEILRLENGRFRTVRVDRVADGGFRASGWREILPGPRILPAATTRIPPYWEPWYRADAPTWFMVRAVGPDGALSAPSAAVQVMSGAAGRARRDVRKALDAELIAFRPRLREEARGAPSAPRDLTVIRDADGAPTLSWTAPAKGEVAGYALYRASVAPEAMRGYAIALAGGSGAEPIRKGDMAILRAELRGIARGDVVTDRIWGAGEGRRLLPRPLDFFSDDSPDRGWTLRDHAPGDPVEEGGRTYLELRLGAGAKATVGQADHGGVDQTYYEVLEATTYRVEVWLRSERPGKAVFRFTGPAGSYRKDVRPIVFATGPQWRRMTADVALPRVLESGIGSMQLAFEGANTFGIDNFRVYPADTAYLDLRARDYARLRDSGVKVLRTHAFIKSQDRTYDLAELTNPGGVTSHLSGGATLPQTLGILSRAHIDPWLQVEPHFTEAEWLGLVEYLAAPAGAGPWADKRVAQGRTAPWTDAFDRIDLEIGNETWNQLFQPWIFTPMTDAATGRDYPAGEVYGMFQQRVIDMLRASPWWAKAGLDSKIRFVLGGWSINTYGEQAARRSPSSAVMGVGAYIGGWDEDQGPPDRTPASYFNMLNQVSQVSIPRARKHAEAVAGIARDRGAGAAPLVAGTYEAGPGYAHNGLGGRMTPDEERAQEEVMKSQAGGVATLDSFLAQAREGYGVQNFFTFSEGVRWASHAFSRHGGQAYPSWKLIALLNREGLGRMLDVRAEAAPTADLPAFKLREAVDGAPLVSVYATRAEDRLNLFVISRRVPGYPQAGSTGCTPTEIALPFAGAKRMTLHRMAGPYDAHNIDADRVRIETLDLPPPADPRRFRVDAASGAADCGLPPASAFLYVFEGLR